MSPTQSFKARVYPTLLVVALLGLGMAKIVVGVSRDKPVGFLIMLCFILVLVAMQLFEGKSFRRPWGNRTRFGDRALTVMRDRHQRPTSVDDHDPQLPMLIALFGVQILAGSSLTDLRTLLMPTPSSAYADSGGGGDTGIGSGCSGGSSCGGGGGGCGGCGGG